MLVCGAIILTLALGVRQTFGLFLQPMSAELNWGRGHYSFALALSNLIWGLAQPFFGAWADKQGSGRVVAVSGLLYAAGLVLMSLSTTPLMLDFSAGLLIGLGTGGGNQTGAYYFPFAQSPQRSYTFAVASTSTVAPAVRSAIARVDPALALFQVETIEQRKRLSLSSRQTAMSLA